jgi:tetratricopeptide (TPR) repeat protein
LTRRTLTVLVAVTTLTHLGGDLRAAPPQERAPDPEQRPVFGADVALETISVGAVDASGVPIAGLTPADFFVKEDDQVREVAFVTAGADAPLDLALILDLSGSMGGGTWRPRTLAFLDALSAQRDCVLLLRFSRTVSTSIWGRPDDPALAAAIEASHTSGATSLYDALVAGIQRLSPHTANIGGDPTGVVGGIGATAGSLDQGCPATNPAANPGDPSSQRRMAVVAVTDGVDSSSGHNMHQVELIAHSTGIPIFQIELAAGGRSTVTMRRTAPRLPTTSMDVGGQRRGGFGDRGETLRDFQKLVAASGGDTFRAGPEAYEQLLGRLRGFYLVGYLIPPAEERATPFEYTRHEIAVEVPGRRGTTLHRPFVYRPAFDAIRAASELEEGIRQLQSQQLEASLAAFARAIEAHGDFAAPHAYMANVLLWTEGVETALASALRATELEPTNGEYHLAASELAGIAEEYDLAWEHAIRGAQAGSAADGVFEDLAQSSEPPADLRARLEAPRVAVLAASPSQPDLIVRAALPRAIRSVQSALLQRTEVAVVPDPRLSSYIVWLVDRDLSDRAPRRFRGRILLTDRAGEILYEDDFTLDNLDDAVENADDLAEHIDKIVETVWEASR